MSQRQSRIAWGTIIVACLCIGLSLSIGHAQNEKAVPVATLLPASTVVYVGWDGNESHKEAWEGTAAYAALYESGLIDAVNKLFAGLKSQAAAQGGDAAAEEASKAISQAFERISANGVSFALSLPDGPGPPIPQATIVLHEAAVLEPGISKFVQSLAPLVGVPLEFNNAEIQNRKVTSTVVPTGPGGPPVQIGWWAEGAHLVIVAGINAVESSVAVAAGDVANLTTNATWKKQTTVQSNFDRTTLAWLDFGALRTKFGAMPLPLPPAGPDAQPQTVNNVLTALGLDKLGAIVCRSGYKGRAMWSETTVESPGPRMGLMAMMDQKPITMADLPPLPFGTNGFYASSIDLSKLYDDIVAIAKAVAAFGPPDAAAQVDGFIAALPQIIGIDLKIDLLDPLGNVACVYGDTRQGFFGMGTGLVIKVDDAEKLRATIKQLLGMAVEANPDDFGIRTATKQGREVTMFQFDKKVPIGALSVDDNWLAIGLIPQTVEAFLLRLDNKLTVWKPTRSYQQGFDELPKEFTSISSSDPRKSYRTVMGFAPIIAGAAQAGLQEAGLIGPDAELPITIADVPPAELVSRPLFPNISVCTVDDQGIHWTSRTSLPGIPFISGMGAGSSVGTTAVLVALLLPAIQQARQAARRSQSKNNLKQLGLGLHNYHDVFNKLPQGTHPNEKLKPTARLSWMADVLPFLDQGVLHQQIDFEKGWEDDANKKWMKTVISTFQSPAQPPAANVDYGTTHYVGVAGLGKDAATLPLADKKVGVFGYDRIVKFRDVTDGLSNTIAIMEVKGGIGAWGAGGPSTIRGLTKKPYINGPDGFGSNFTGGLNSLLLDGSVRFLSENIDPAVLEALSTIHGGEQIPQF